MTRWALVVQETEGVGNDRIWGTKVLAEIEGNREEALAELRRLVPSYTPQHPFNSPCGAPCSGTVTPIC